MASPLPGMPLRIGDPGVFVCGPEDIQPRPRPPRHLHVVKPPPPPADLWLVLRLCEDCGPAYCREHDEKNWWLRTWGRNGNTPGSTA